MGPGSIPVSQADHNICLKRQMGLVSCFKAVETVVIQVAVLVTLLTITCRYCCSVFIAVVYLLMYMCIADFTLCVCLKVSTRS